MRTAKDRNGNGPTLAWALEQTREIELAKKTCLTTGMRPVFAVGYLLCVTMETIIKSFFRVKNRRTPKRLSDALKGLAKLGISLPWSNDQHEYHVSLIESLREVSVHAKMLSMLEEHETRSTFFHRVYAKRVQIVQTINIIILRQVCLNIQVHTEVFPENEEDRLYEVRLPKNIAPIKLSYIRPASIWPAFVIDLSIFEFSLSELAALRYHNCILSQNHSSRCLPLCEISSLFFCLEYLGDILSKRDATQRYSFEFLLETILQSLGIKITRNAVQKIASFRRSFTHSDFSQLQHLFPYLDHLNFTKRNKIAYDEVFDISFRILTKAKETLSIRGFFHLPSGFEARELRRNPVFARRIAREGSRFLTGKYTLRPSGLFVPSNNARN